MATFNFTLLFYLSLALAVAASTNHNNFDLYRRDHADLGRLVKKRTPIDILANQPSVETPSVFPPAQSSQDSSAAAQTTPANSVSAQSPSAAVSASKSTSPSSTGGGGLLSSVIDGLLPTESDTRSSTLPTTSSSASGSSSNSLQTLAHTGNTPTTAAQSILYLTSGSMPTPTQTSTTSSSSGMSHAAVTVLIVIAASVGAAVIVWTIIRKWKFRPSSDFEGRMQPIDWQPGRADEDAGLSGQHRRLSRTSSFHSGSGNALDDHMHGPVGRYGTSALNPIPDHDFTAGPAHLAPVGGYADLARDASPQPMMQESLARAPSINRPMQYDQYGVPLHHGYSGY